MIEPKPKKRRSFLQVMGGRKSLGFYMIFIAATALVAASKISDTIWLSAVVASYGVFSGVNALIERMHKK